MLPHRLKIGLFIGLGGLLVVCLLILFYFVHSPMPIIYSASELYRAEAHELHSAYFSALKRHKLLALTEEFVERNGAIDWLCSSNECASYSETRGLCSAKNTTCFSYDSGVVAYNPKQTLDLNNKTNFINITVIPGERDKSPASILLFGDGRVLSGSHYNLGNQAKYGLEIIKTDPDYIKK